MNRNQKPADGSGIETFPENRRRFWTLFFSLPVLPLMLRAERTFLHLPQLSARANALNLPSLSIIAPARNEAQNLHRVLPSLERKDYPAEIEEFVADGYSTNCTVDIIDKTQRDLEIMQEGGCCIMCAPAAPLPKGWQGKPNGNHAGAFSAYGESILFTDADTENETYSAASAVAFARENGLDGLSLLPKLETQGLPEGALLVAVFASLFAWLRRSTRMVNGSYILVRRATYEVSGGFAKVWAEIKDDLAYGLLLAGQGYQLPIMRGESQGSVRMYKNGRQNWHGVSQLVSRPLRYSGLMALIPALFVTGLMTPLWTLLFNRRCDREIPNLW